MIYADNQNTTDPRLNLAMEEHLLRNAQLAEPIVFFYVNEPAVIIGRNQVTLQEIDPDYVEAEGIHVVRRLSGGGAVYHDLGNLNFSFITSGSEDLHNFGKFTQPVIDVLRALGVDAELRGKSDIFAAGKKISGNAQYMTRGRMFSHGTLLFDTHIERMLRALNPRQAQVESRAVQSVRNFVTNIRELLPAAMDVHGLRQALLDGLFGGGTPPAYAWTAADWAEVERIADGRYRTWEWNVGRSPAFNVRKEGKTPAGSVDVRIDVTGGRVQGIRFLGNFASRRDVAELEAALVGVAYERAALETAVAPLDLTPYFGEMEKGAFVRLLY
ncbi:MAG: lipoate--protein ligase [Anaerolineales bacterium]|nr:lipoate--protein ligase [Anaerolineales bacterium]